MFMLASPPRAKTMSGSISFPSVKRSKERGPFPARTCRSTEFPSPSRTTSMLPAITIFGWLTGQDIVRLLVVRKISLRSMRSQYETARIVRRVQAPMAERMVLRFVISHHDAVVEILEIPGDSGSIVDLTSSLVSLKMLNSRGETSNRFSPTGGFRRRRLRCLLSSGSVSN